MAGFGGAKVRVKGDWNGQALKSAERDLSAFGKNVDGFSNSVKGSFLGVGAAIGAAFSLDAVVNFMKGAAQAAMEDERSMVALAKAMENVGLAAQNAGVEAFIEDLMLARGVADDELRPAFQQLVTVTGDVAESQKAMSLALDISAGTGRDLQSVSQALSRAYTGQTTALQRLGTGIDAATLKSKDMDLITAALNERFQGQSAAAAETYQGQINRLNVAVGEATESIGYSLLNALDKVSRLFGGAGGFQSAVEKATLPVISLTDGIAELAQELEGIGVGAGSSSSNASKGLKILDDSINLVGTSYAFWDIPGQIAGIVRQTRWLTDANYRAERRQAALLGVLEQTGAWMPQYVEMINMGAQANLRLAGTVQDVQSTFNASAFYGVNPSAQRAFADARANVNQIVEDYKKVQQEQSNVGSSAGKAAEVIKVKWKEIADSVDGAVIRISGRATEVSGKLADTFKERTDLFREVVKEQVSIIQEAQQSLDDYAAKVTDAIMGKIDFTTTDAEGNPLTPEQIFNLIMGDIANQQAAVTKIAESGIMTQLPTALAEKILTLPPDAAVALANYFSANPAQLEQLTKNYNDLATFTTTALGIPMAQTFATIGDESAVKMIEKAKETIKEQAASFKRYVQDKLTTTITVQVRYEAVNSVPGVGGGQINVPLKIRANGGPISDGFPTLVGERGPELIIPKTAGTVVRGEKTRQMLRGGGGDVYLTVNAGIGTNGPEVGRQIVEALKAYERRNGAVYASA